mmetsp:Transcript_10350/g.11395  ORF Transcript_10350/g.11395 Transcript_10350/m.11395 type:complete len:152 (-) Transcript_10350:105-560(-)
MEKEEINAVKPVSKPKRKRSKRPKQKKRRKLNNVAIRRTSYLIQAADLVADSNPELARYYAYTIKKVAKKVPNDFRLGADVKANICRYCHAVLISGVNKQTRMKAQRETHVVVTCTECGALQQRRMVKRPKPRVRRTDIQIEETTVENYQT